MTEELTLHGNSDTAYFVIEELAEVKGSKAKVEFLKKYRKDNFMLAILEQTYDPYITYGIKKLPSVNTVGDNLFDTETRDLLIDLANRELTGNAASERVKQVMENLTHQSQKLLRMILGRSLNIGMGASSINKAIPGLIPTFECMLAHKYEPHRIKEWPAIIEPKLDGVRVIAVVNLAFEQVNFFSRSGKEFTTFDHIKEDLLNTIGMSKSDWWINESRFILDGEVMSGIFNKTVGDVRRKDFDAKDAIFHIFDAMSHAHWDKKLSEPYHVRRKNLENLESEIKSDSALRVVPAYKVSSEWEIGHYYDAFRKAGLEGAIVKNRAELYARKRSYSWMKIKAQESVDARVTGHFEGTGKYVGMLGGLIVTLGDVDVRVGGGFSDEQRQSFWKAAEKDAKNKVAGSGDLELYGRMIEVEYHEETPDGSLRHPRFVRFRDDKEES